MEVLIAECTEISLRGMSFIGAVQLIVLSGISLFKASLPAPTKDVRSLPEEKSCPKTQVESFRTSRSG